MLAEELSVRREEHHRAIERSSIALDRTQRQIDLVLLRNSAEPGGGRSGHLDRSFPVGVEFIPPFRGAVPDSRAEGKSAGISTDKCLGKEHQARAAGRSLVRQGFGLGEGGGEVIPNRRGLHDRHSMLGCFHMSARQ